MVSIQLSIQEMWILLVNQVKLNDSDSTKCHLSSISVANLNFKKQIYQVKTLLWYCRTWMKSCESRQMLMLLILISCSYISQNIQSTGVFDKLLAFITGSSSPEVQQFTVSMIFVNQSANLTLFSMRAFKKNIKSFIKLFFQLFSSQAHIYYNCGTVVYIG